MGLRIKHKITFVFLLCVLNRVEIKGTSVDYYWRDYAGIIPDDAVPGGYDLFNRSTYIGQGYVKKYGIIPGTIYPGVKHIDVPIKGVSRVPSYVKILCGANLSFFKWIPVNANQYHIKMINKHSVLGGEEYTSTHTYALNIGRMTLQGIVLIGKVIASAKENAGIVLMWYVSEGTQRSVKFYEVLTYVPHD